jgi:hypothetical protein
LGKSFFPSKLKAAGWRSFLHPFSLDGRHVVLAVLFLLTGFDQ